MSDSDDEAFGQMAGGFIILVLAIFVIVVGFILLVSFGGGVLLGGVGYFVQRKVRPLVTVGKLDPQQNYREPTFWEAFTGINPLPSFGITFGIGLMLFSVLGEASFSSDDNGQILGFLPPESLLVVGLWVLGAGVLLLVLDLVINFRRGVVYLSPTGVLPKEEAERVLDTSHEYQRPVYTIYVDPQQMKKMDFYIETFMRETIGYFGECVFRIEADEKHLRWQVVDLVGKSELKTFSEFVRAHFPEASVMLETAPNITKTPFFRELTTYRYSDDERVFYRPIKRSGDLKTYDPLLSISQHLSTLKNGQLFRYSLLVAGIAPHANREGYEGVTEYAGWFAHVRALLGDKNASRKQSVDISDEQFQSAQDKLGQPLYLCFLFTESDADTGNLATVLSQTVDKRIHEFSHDSDALEVRFDEILTGSYTVDIANHPISKYGFLVKYEHFKKEPLLRTEWESARLILDLGEMAALWHLPDPRFTSSKIAKPQKVAEVSKALADNKQGFVFGEGTHLGQSVEVRIPEATLATHLSILGKSGMGKSTFLLNLISQTIAAGHGCAVLDPHGDLVVDVLEGIIPSEREKDVVVLDLSDPELLIPFNVFSSGQSEASIGQIGAVIELAQKREAGDQTARYMEQGLFAISYLDNPTMLDLRKFLSDATFRGRVLDLAHNGGDFDVVEFWEDEYNELTDTKQRTYRAPIMNRVDLFSRSKYLRPMFCHPDGLPLTQWMDEKKIILLSLKTDPLKVSATHQDLIGAIFISMLQTAGMNPHRKRTPFYVFADEMQRFKTPAFGVMFSEARKFNLLLTIAHQFADQLDKNILSAIIGNVGTKAIFGCGETDARRLGVTVKDAFEPSELERLDKYTMALRTVLDGSTQPSCLVRTYPPPQKRAGAAATAQRIRALSKAAYTPKTREEVNQWLSERYPRRGRGRDGAPENPAPSDGDNDDSGGEFIDGDEFYG